MVLTNLPRSFSHKGGLGWQADAVDQLFAMSMSRHDLVGMQVPWLEAPELTCELCMHLPPQPLSDLDAKRAWFESVIQALTVPLPHRAVIWTDATKQREGSGIGVVMEASQQPQLRLHIKFTVLVASPGPSSVRST